jgi:hypothetical protein
MGLAVSVWVLVVALRLAFGAPPVLHHDKGTPRTWQHVR